MDRQVGLLGLKGWLGSALVVVLAGCAAQSANVSASGYVASSGPLADDRSRCDFRGRTDREVVEAAGPGASFPNVRRVYQLIGTGEERHKVLICREIDTNLDGIKDVVRVYNEKGEAPAGESSRKRAIPRGGASPIRGSTMWTAKSRASCEIPTATVRRTTSSSIPTASSRG